MHAKLDAMLKLTTIILLLIAALRMLTLVLHTPVIGYANQYDMLRSSACLDLWPGSAAEKRSDAQISLATVNAPTAVYQRRVFDRSNCYWSTDVALVAVALTLHRVAITGNDVDLRWLGAVKTLLLLAAILWLSALLWRYPRIAAMNALVAALVLADPHVMLYANTLYTEFGAVLGLYLSIAGALAWSVSCTQTYLAPKRRALAALMLGLAALACARVPHAPLAIVLGGVVLYFAWQAQRQVPYRLVLALLLPLALGAAVAARNQHALAGVAQANASNTLFFTILPSAPDAAALAQALALPAHCGELAFSSWYMRRNSDVSRDCPEAYRFSRARLAAVLAAHPQVALRVLANALAQSRGWRITYVGEVAGAEMVRAPFWSVADWAPKLPYPLYLALTLFALCFAVLGALKVKNAGAMRLNLSLLSVALTLPMLISLLGDGYTELPRHAHLATVTLVALLLVLIAQAKSIGIGRFVMAVMASGALGLTLCLQPAAISAWDHPLKAYAGQRIEISGWALDAFGLVEIYAASHGHAKQSLAFTPRTGVDAVFQGYPNSEFTGVKASVVITAPYTEIRVRNRLGVETAVDRIWTTANPEPAAADPTAR